MSSTRSTRLARRSPNASNVSNSSQWVAGRLGSLPLRRFPTPQHVEEEDIEGTLCDDRRVELAEGAGGGVAWVRERLLAALHQRLVVRLEGVAGHVGRPRRPDPRAGSVGHPEASRGQIGWSGPARSRRRLRSRRHEWRRANVFAVLVNHLDGEAVELRLADVLDRVRVDPSASSPFRTRPSNSRTASASVALSMERIGATCSTVASSSSGSPPTRRVGSSGSGGRTRSPVLATA